MITIDIPVSNYRQTESDRFLTDILAEILNTGECKLFHYGAGLHQTWQHGYTLGHDCTGTLIPLSDDSYDEVINALRKKGYAIINGGIIAAGQYVTIKG